MTLSKDQKNNPIVKELLSSFFKFKFTKKKIKDDVYRLDFTSSNLSMAIIDLNEGNMILKFKSGAIYEYSNIDKELMNDWNLVDSSGSFFYWFIRAFPSTYPYKKISIKSL